MATRTIINQNAESDNPQRPKDCVPTAPELHIPQVRVLDACGHGIRQSNARPVDRQRRMYSLHVLQLERWLLVL